MRKNHWLLAILLFGGGMAASLAAEEPKLAAEESEADTAEYLGYGFALTDGQAAIAADTVFVLSPENSSLILHPDEQDRAKEALRAKAYSETEWEVTLPEDGRTIKVRVVYAAYEYDTAEIKAPFKGSSLPAISLERVVRVPFPTVISYKLRRGHLCGEPGNCGFDCYHGHLSFSPISDFLVCRYTGNPYHLCLEWLAPVCLGLQWEC